MKVQRVVLLLFGFLLLAITLSWLAGTTVNQQMTWTALQEALRQGEIAGIDLEQERVIVQDRDGQRRAVYWPGSSSSSGAAARLLDLVESLPAEQRPDIEGSPPPFSWLALLITAGVIVLLIMLVRSLRGGMQSFTGSVGRQADRELLTGLDHIGGIDHVRDEIRDLLLYLTEPERYQQLGAVLPRGVLLVGPPGTGKTMLAKAIAKEAEVPFLHLSGSDFVELFVGVGAARVRGLFSRARKQQPSIIFIDEIDAIGKTRGGGQQPGNQEYEQTLNAILVELDGFRDRDQVLVIAASNRLDALDKALLRPGRFDRHIHVTLPTRDERV
ncbi:MAG: AAA family ATPase, partial [Planctomycetota bacterium]